MILLLVFLVVAVVLLYFSNTPMSTGSLLRQEGMDSYSGDSALAPSDLAANNSIMIPASAGSNVVPDGASPIQGGSGY